jgi:hypothetical protein
MKSSMTAKCERTAAATRGGAFTFRVAFSRHANSIVTSFASVSADAICMVNSGPKTSFCAILCADQAKGRHAWRL